EGWEGSVRRQALFALANGPMDWTVEAALLALTVIAQQDDRAVPEVAQLFRDLRRELPTGARVCYDLALLCCSLQLPALTVAERSALWQEFKEYERRERMASTGGIS